LPKTARRTDAPEVERTINHVWLRCPTFMCEDGYGNSAEQMALAIQRAGVDISVGGTSQGGGMNRFGHSNATEIADRSYNDTRIGDALIWYSQPPAWYKTGRKKTIGFTMFESTAIPDEWIAGLAKVDEIWVPSPFCAEVFGQYEMRAPIEVVSLGVNPKDFPPMRRQRREKLRFLHDMTHLGELRKGAQLAIDAFLEAFPDRPDVELVVRAAWPDATQSIQTKDPRVTLRVERLRTLQLCAVYHDFDAMIYPSRGEGFGLIPLQAMMTGMPTIYPDATSLSAFKPYGLPVSAKKVPTRVGDGRPGVPLWNFRNGAYWFEPNITELVDRLREIDQNYDAVQDTASAQAESIGEEWNWDRTAARMLERLEA
jgi:glycosyltransferase involved in cell wall biosynthesis